MAKVEAERAQMTDAEKAQALPERSATQDLLAVGCKTHKESMAEIAQLAKNWDFMCLLVVGHRCSGS